MASKSKKRSISSTSKAGTPVSSPVVTRAVSNRATTTEFKPDYSYVKTDLKRIGILAGSFFVVLVVLSFFLR